MSYNFIKDGIETVFSNGRINLSELEKFIAFKDNGFILKHNINAISKFITFLNSPNNIFILNGFMGEGKTYTSDTFMDFVSDDVLIFKNSYQEAINLDDVLLSIFRDFSIYQNDKKIVLPKVESNIFSEKMNSFIKYCDAPMLFVFDSFEINTRSKDTQKDILDFINYLSHFEKVKILICSRSFFQNDLISEDSVVSYKLESLTKEEMIDYININSVKGSSYEVDELYKATRGHYVLVELSVLIMNLLQINLAAFSTDYKKSTRNFLEFLISKIFSISSDKFIKLLVLLAVIRHGLTKNFIIENGFASDDDIAYLIQKRVIAEKFGQYYLKDYVKNEYKKTISAETKIKVHEYLIKLYDSELPLKPFERELFISRQTMRQEIEFHKKKIEKLKEEIAKSGRARASEVQDFNYLTYSKNSGYENKYGKTKEKRSIQNIKSRISTSKNRYELSKEDAMLLNTSSGESNIEKQLTELADIEDIEARYLNETPVKSAEDMVPECLDDYLEIAQNYENVYNFSSAILYYKKALTYKNDENYNIKAPIIYTKLAICYKGLQDYEEAIRIYEKVYQMYINESVEKANEVLLNIAQIYNEVYKFDKVKEVYNRILFSKKGCSSAMTIRVYLNMAELEDNNLDIKASIECVKKALKEAEKISNISLLCECYFRYALLLDDNNDIDMAQKYYLRCIQCSKNPEENLYLSSAYVNLAEISLDNKNLSAAKMYFELATDADKKVNNYEALFYSYSKLAELYKKESPEKRYEYLVKALSSAKRFDDISYAVSVYVEIGDYYYDLSEYKRALKSYLLAKTLMPPHISENVSRKINSGINKVKVALGDSEYLKILNEIKKKK